jgi:hypothetical protein
MAMRKTRAVTESKMLSHLRLPVSFNVVRRGHESLPLGSLTSLPARAYTSSRDTSSLDSSSQNILVGRHIIRIRDPGNSIKVAVNQLKPILEGEGSLLRSRIVQLQFVPPIEGLPDALIGPKFLDCLGEFGRHLITFNLDWGGHDDIPSRLVVGANGYFHERNSFEQDPGC